MPPLTKTLLRTSTIPRLRLSPQRRHLSTLENNPHIYIFPHPSTQGTHILTYLQSSPPRPELAIGTTTQIPPTPDSLTENPRFLTILQSVAAEHATGDPVIRAAAAAHASQAGSGLGSGGAFFGSGSSAKRRSSPSKSTTSSSSASSADTGAGGASAQGGVGGAARGGFVHVADLRNPPDWGRVAWPEDILGSVEVDARGDFVGPTGEYRQSGTYRVCTREGILGLSEYLRGKLVERLRLEEQALE